jgi:hypothetical protein
MMRFLPASTAKSWRCRIIRDRLDGPHRLPNRAASGLCLPLGVGVSRHPVGSPRPLGGSFHARGPHHPGRPSECMCLWLPRWHCPGFLLLAGRATFSLLTRPNRVPLR